MNCRLLLIEYAKLLEESECCENEASEISCWREFDRNCNGKLGAGESDRVLWMGYSTGERPAVRRALIAAISSGENPIPASEADQVGGSPVNLDRVHHISISTSNPLTKTIPFIYMDVVLEKCTEIRRNKRQTIIVARTWKFHGMEMDGSSAGSEDWESSETLDLEDFGVLGRRVKEGSLKIPFREPAESGESVELDGDRVMSRVFGG